MFSPARTGYVRYVQGPIPARISLSRKDKLPAGSSSVWPSTSASAHTRPKRHGSAWSSQRFLSVLVRLAAAGSTADGAVASGASK